MKHTLIILKNFYKQTFSEPKKYFYTLGFPVLSFLGVFILFGMGGGENKIRLGIINDDKGEMSSYIIEEIEKTEGYEISFSSESLEIQLVSEKSDIILKFPQGFSDLHKDHSKAVLYTVQNPAFTIGLKFLINDTLSNYSLLKESAGEKDFDNLFKEYRSGEIMVESAPLDAVNVSFSGTRALGFLLLFIFGQGIAITALILRNKQDKTYYRIRTAPVSEFSYLAGNLTAAFFILLIQILVGLTAATLIFSYNFLKLLPVLIVFSLFVISLGLLITSLTKSQQTASNISVLLMTPLSMLGGCFWGVDLMPGIMQDMALFVPQYWAMNAIEQMTFKAVPDIRLNILILLGFTLLCSTLFVYRVKQNKNA